MDFKQVLKNRKSVKSFSHQPIPESKIDALLYAARLAPSWGNNQCWKVMILKDEETIDKVAETLSNSNSAKQGVSEAPVLIVVCAVPDSSAEIDGKEYYLVDAGIAMEHMILAAADEGLGSCWVGEFDEMKIKTLLRIPGEYRVVALSPIGYSRENAGDEVRLPISEWTFTNQWGNYLH